ncbi:hypothetical protein C0995_010968, partial [Termitomyces sp. Mi166
SSVACLEADILADAAGVPSKLTRTEHHLEDSGISVAPPQRQRDVGTTLPPCPTHARSTHACVQHAINQGGSEVQMSDEEHGDIKRAGAKSKAEMIGENEGADEDKGEDEDEGADGDEEEDRDETELGSEGDGDEGDGNKAELSGEGDRGEEGDEDEEGNKDKEGDGDKGGDGDKVGLSSERGNNMEMRDKHMPTTPPHKVQGSSHATGGISQGHAVGNALNIGDLDDLDLDGHDNAPGVPIQGKANSHIYVDEDGDWILKGKYDKAVFNVEPLNWQLSDYGKLFTALHAENLTTGYFSIISGSGTLDLAVPHDIQSSNTKSVTLSADIAESLSETQHLLITTLSISPSLLDCSKHDLCYAFAKYEAIQDTLKKVNIMFKDGTWKHQ